MEKDNSQLELFSQVKGGGSFNNSAPASFLSYIRAYEKTLLVIIGFIITGVVAFSFGVEKGRNSQTAPTGQLLALRPVSRQTQAHQVVMSRQVPYQAPVPQVATPRQVPYQTTVPQVATAQPAAPRQVLHQAPVPQVATSQAAVGTYTIQLGSFQSKEYAQLEANALRKRGLSPILLSQGSYTVLCVGKFVSKDAAQSLLSELTKQYRGCYIRRL
ncbi:MAG TPA: SPOR domain-containing protein [Patescibacteria group bacterium]|nr:SPOR domain-containing protein [Patescibacteria group bacterium]